MDRGDGLRLIALITTVTYLASMIDGVYNVYLLAARDRIVKFITRKPKPPDYSSRTSARMHRPIWVFYLPQMR